MKAGSLFSGTGALDMAATAVLGCEPAWFVEQDEAASKVLAHHWPGVPNYGDITAVHWSAVEPVEVLAGGFPCQDISNAGKRAGIEGERSGLWSYFAEAIRVLRPRYVLVENVSALVVRGLDRVLADLAALGFDAEWACVRASDVGAPHRRERIFLAAGDAAVRGRYLAPAADRGGERSGLAGGPGVHTAHSPRDGWHEGRAEPAGELRRPDVAQRGVRPAAHSDSPGLEGPQPEERRDVLAGRAAPDTNGARQHQPPRLDADVSGRVEDGGVRPDRWAEYAVAVHRWELALGRQAPPPVEWSDGYRRRRARRLARLDTRPIGMRGSLAPQFVLSPRFVEWMMGLPAGHVTAVDGLSRGDMLKLLGNGVVVQQGAAAFRHLLPLLSEGRWAA